MLQLNKNLNKVCSKCKIIKELKQFKLRCINLVRTHAHVDSYCIPCRQLYDKKRHRASKVKSKEKKNEKEKSV